VTGEDTQHAVDAFGLLSHETRMAAMYVLWEAGAPLRFSEIADRAGISDTGNFNYHFGKLVGEYVRDHGETYGLTRAGRQAMTAVVAGEVTRQPSFSPVELEESCPYCGASVELTHGEDKLRVRCRSCAGTFETGRETTYGTTNPEGTLSAFAFPPSGLRNRDPDAILDVALERYLGRMRELASGICPDCAGPVDRTVSLCRDHDAAGICPACSSRFAGEIAFKCNTCRMTNTSLLIAVCVRNPQVQVYFADHGYDLVAPSWETFVAILSVTEHLKEEGDELAYTLSWTFDDETLRIYLDETGRIQDWSRQ
jgi:hypothetical protein